MDSWGSVVIHFMNKAEDLLKIRELIRNQDFDQAGVLKDKLAKEVRLWYASKLVEDASR